MGRVRREDHADGVAVLILDQPERRNALDLEMVAALEEQLTELRLRPPSAAILSGEGLTFCSGADLRDLASLSGRDAAMAYSARLQELCAALEALPCPTLAAIEGHALGAGLELALSLDLRVVGETARLGLPEILHGLVPAAGGTQRLPEAVGAGWARAMILGGMPVDAAAAVQIGLGTSLTPPTTALASALGRARELAQSGPAVLAFRRTRLAARGEGFRRGLEAERQAFADLMADRGVRERILGFLSRAHSGRGPTVE